MCVLKCLSNNNNYYYEMLKEYRSLSLKLLITDYISSYKNISKDVNNYVNAFLNFKILFC